MTSLKQHIKPVILITLWVGFSEFLRNELLFKSVWTDHYDKLGVVFPSRPINGALWVIWSVLFAVTIRALAQKFTFRQTILLSWNIGFVMMWVVLGNLAILPPKILFVAIPLSIIETIGATLIATKDSK